MIITTLPTPSKRRLIREQLAIRQRLALRFIVATQTWEVYTTKHGSDSRNGIFRWYTVDAETANWYQENFKNIPVTVE